MDNKWGELNGIDEKMLSQAVCLGMSLRESIEQLLYVIKISSTGTRKFGIKKKKNIIPSNLKLIRNHNTNSPFMPPELRSKPPEGENPKISLLKTLKRKWVGYSGRHSQRDKMLILLQACKIGNIAVAGRYNISMKSIEDWRAWFKKRGAGGLIDLTGAVKKYGIPEKKVLEWYEQFKSEENGLPSMNDIRRFVATLPTPPPLGESFISYAMHRNHLEIVSPSPEKRKVQKEIKRYIRETFPIIGESMKKIEVVVNTSEMALFEDIQGLFSRQTPMDSRNPLKRHLQQNRDRICLILSICSDGTLLSPMFIFRSKWSSSMNKNKNSSKIMEQRKEYFGYYTEPKIIVEGTETGWNSAPHGDRIGQQIVQKYLPGRVMWVRDSSVQRPLSEKQPEQLTSIILPYNCAVFAQPLDAGRIFDQIKEVIRMKYFIFLKSHGMTPHLPDLLIHWTISAIKDLTPRRIKEAFVLAGLNPQSTIKERDEVYKTMCKKYLPEEESSSLKSKKPPKINDMKIENSEQVPALIDFPVPEALERLLPIHESNNLKEVLDINKDDMTKPMTDERNMEGLKMEAFEELSTVIYIY